MVASAKTGTLYVVATPLGNLGDLSPRALEVLRSVAVVAAEDTRRTRQLFSYFGVAAPTMVSLPAFDERGRMERVLGSLESGEDVALCSDAGTPGISDPGEALVAAAWERGARVVPIPGPCAAIAALVASGLPTSQFFFAGFLPRKGGARREAMESMAEMAATIVLYEAGNRTAATLRDLAAALGDRSACVARELTKLHEEIARGTLLQLAARFSAEVRGEVTLVIAGATEGATETEDERPLDEELAELLAAGGASTEIAKRVAKRRGLKRSEVYARLETLKKRKDTEP
jgi:16S rRNA (cytidine1402-2'-O)-methyltransferase